MNEQNERNAQILESLCDAMKHQLSAMLRAGVFPDSWDGH